MLTSLTKEDLIAAIEELERPGFINVGRVIGRTPLSNILEVCVK